MASLERQNDNKNTGSRNKKRSNLQKHDSKPGSSRSKLSDSRITRFLKALPQNQVGQKELHLNVIPQSKKADMSNGTTKVFSKSTCIRKKALSKLRGSYSLRSLDSGRVLRSKLDAAKCNTSGYQVSKPENLVTRAKRRRKKMARKSDQDELSRIKKFIRYMLNRMNYEQSLIDAYSGEGWKGQSAEKIRPERELGRAKSEILRCKLKIREIFQHLDSLLAEGRLQESLFDFEGIDSENIFCGKCRSKEVSADNDIILCDGVCERGFHQKCLNPHLLSEDIPSGDEGWLCPQCDCKLECIDLLSEFLGKDLSIEDSWEKFFPEAAVLANGNEHDGDLNLPSDDSEDDEYNPDSQRAVLNEQEEEPGYEDSRSSLYDSTSSDNNVGQATAELSTDDSEDENYDPDAVNPDKEIQKSKSSSDESDFTSDSDEFCAELVKNTHADEASASSPPNLNFFIDSSRDNMKDQDELLDSSKLPSPMLEVQKQVDILRLTNKRDRERLDYKKLYEEAYGKSSSDSSDDGDWNEMSSKKKLMKIDNKELEEAYSKSSSDSSDDEDWNEMSSQEKLMKIDNNELEDAIHTVANLNQSFQKNISSISTSVKAHVPLEPHSTNGSPGIQRKSGVASKILYEAFRENQYPTKEKKEGLAQELGMTFQQVTKWFGNTRHSFRAATPHKAPDTIKTTTLEDYYKKKLNEVSQENQYKSKEKKEGLAQEQGMTPQKALLYEAFQENQYPTKEKKESLAQKLSMTFQQVNKWFGNTRHSFRAASALHGATDAACTTAHEAHYKKKLIEVFQENQHPSKEVKEELAQELGISSQKVSRWFDAARRNFHAFAKESANTVTSGSDKAEASGSQKLDTGAADNTPGRKGGATQSCTNLRKRRDSESSETPSSIDGDFSHEKVNKAVGSTARKGESGGNRDGGVKEGDRQKAVAKELRRMRTRR